MGKYRIETVRYQNNAELTEALNQRFDEGFEFHSFKSQAHTRQTGHRDEIVFVDRRYRNLWEIEHFGMKFTSEKIIRNGKDYFIADGIEVPAAEIDKIIKKVEA